MRKEITLVTGGSSGLGLEIARLHLIKGDNVCIVGRNQERLNDAERNLRQINNNAELLCFPCNVADEAKVEGIFQELNDREYLVRHVYNVAGRGLYGEPTITSRKMVDSLLEANFIGLIIVSVQAVKYMKNNGGLIVNVISSAAKKANPKETVYCGVKWGARGYTEALTAALKGSSIKTLAVYPGGMNTPFWVGDIGLSPDVSSFMDPKEVAEVIVDAAANRNSLKLTEISIDRK